MHYLDANKTAGKKARQQFHMNAASNIEQDLAATPNKVPTIRKLSKLDEPDMQDTAGEAGTSSKVMYSYRPTHMAEKKQDEVARTYIEQLCEDTGCGPEDLPEAMNDREKWRERVRDIRASGTTWWYL